MLVLIVGSMVAVPFIYLVCRLIKRKTETKAPPSDKKDDDNKV